MQRVESVPCRLVHLLVHRPADTPARRLGRHLSAPLPRAGFSQADAGADLHYIATKASEKHTFVYFPRNWSVAFGGIF